VSTRYVESLDPFFLPGHHAPQTVSTITVNAPARSNFIIPNVGSALTPEGIYVYKGQVNTDGSGGNALWEVIGTPNLSGDGGVTFSNPIRIGTAAETQNTNYDITESFKNSSSGMATSYDIAWDQYNGSQYNLELQITQINSDGTFGSSTIFSPLITEGGATSVTIDPAHMPAWQFRSIGSSTNAVYALAIAEADTSAVSNFNLTGQQHDAIHFQAYAANGCPANFSYSNPLIQSFTIQPDLSHYASGATNHIVWQTIPSLSSYPGQTAQAIQFVQVSSANGGRYAVAWNETVNDSAGTHDQVEFALTGTGGFHTTFQIADGLAQNIRIGEFSDPAVAGQDDVVVVYGDDFGTHILEYGVTNGSTQQATVATLASFSDPTTEAFGNLTVMGDGRMTLTYDNLVNALPDETSQYLFKTFDLRTTGLNVNDSSLNDGQNKYFAGTHYTDNVTGESGVNNEYYFVGQNTSNGPGPTDHFTSGSSVGWNVAIFSDARSDYTITSGGSNAATVTSNGIDPEHTGSLVASNVQVLAFGPATDPTPHNNTIDVNGGTDVVIGGNSPITIEAGSTAEIDTASSYSGSVTFNAPTGTLKLDDPTHFGGQISGLSGTDGIDLKGFDDASTVVTPDSTNASTVLTITDATHTVADNTALNITLLGDYTNSTFAHSSDSNGGVLIVDPRASSGPVGPVVVHDPGPAASNTIVASAPNQTLTGGGISDTFVFNFAGVGKDTVTDFHPAADALQFSSSIFANAQAALNATQDDGHGNTVVAIDAQDTITLTAVLKAQLHVADFHVV
ncbi:MAG: Ig family protein, partial [Bradyrhizobium sp.]|nr:Ig family protein [Bradyrhizobium sp.]